MHYQVEVMKLNYALEKYITHNHYQSFFAQFGASRTMLHNFKYKNQRSIEKLS